MPHAECRMPHAACRMVEARLVVRVGSIPIHAVPRWVNTDPCGPKMGQYRSMRSQDGSIPIHAVPRWVNTDPYGPKMGQYRSIRSEDGSIRMRSAHHVELRARPLLKRKRRAVPRKMA